MAGTVLFLAFVAWKMRRRVHCCCAGADAEDSERQAILSAAAVLFQAAAKDPQFRWDRRPGRLGGSTLLYPTQMASPCSPPLHWCTGSACSRVRCLLTSHLPTSRRRRLAPGAASPYTSPTLDPPEIGTPPSLHSPAASCHAEAESPACRSSLSASRLQSPPLPRPLSPPQAPGGSPSRSAGSQTQPRHGTVRALVQTWASFGRDKHSAAEAEAAAVVAAAALPAGDVESQQQEARAPSAAAEARAFTWSQLGISPTSSRRTSENAAASAPRRATGEMHANPIFVPVDWAAPAADDGGGGAAMARRTLSRSRLSRGVSFADTADGADSSTHGGRMGGSNQHSPAHSRRSSFLQPGVLAEAAQGQHGSTGMQMSSRPSEQSLLRLRAELQRIRE